MTNLAFKLLFALTLTTAVAYAGETVNTTTVGLSGYSPVSYFDGAPAVGSPRYTAEHEGVTYFFRSKAEVARFRAVPARYAPAYGGWCAYGIALGKYFKVDPTNYKIVNDRLLVFLKNEKVDTLKLWNDGDEAKLTSQADNHWKRLSRKPSRAYLRHHNLPASGIAIDGYSPVSYFTKGRAERGDVRFAVEHKGITYHLTSASQVERFNKSPERFVPAYGGWCAFGMAVGDKFPIDPTAFKIVDGRLNLFLRNEGVDALALWNDGDERTLARRAKATWTKTSS